MKKVRTLERLIAWEDHQFKDELIAPGVKRGGHHWGVLFEGKRDALIAAGVAGADWFSDCTERNKRGFIIRRKRLTLNGRKIKTGVSAQGRCNVSISYTVQEQDAAFEAYKCAMQHQEDIFKSRDHMLFALYQARQDQKFQRFVSRILGN